MFIHLDAAIYFMISVGKKKKKQPWCRLDGPLVKIGCSVDFPNELDLEDAWRRSSFTKKWL